MARPLVHDKAREDVEAIAAHIAQDNLAAALRFVDAAEMAFDFLAATPGAGPRIEPPIEDLGDVRFWPITPFRNYLVIYRPAGDGVEVFRVLHGHRDVLHAIAGNR
jgi:toxin ParE1/3/4